MATKRWTRRVGKFEFEAENEWSDPGNLRYLIFGAGMEDDAVCVGLGIFGFTGYIRYLGRAA